MHRNTRIIVLEDGTIIEHEHGPRGGDEINLIEPGRNHGWPAITYGIDYSGALISPLKNEGNGATYSLLDSLNSTL